MENFEAIERIDQTLDKLESSFKSFQAKQEQRLNQLYVAQNRPLQAGEELTPDVYQQKQTFMNYITKGQEDYHQKALTSQDGNTGGYLIPSVVVERFQDVLKNASSLRALARVSSISTDTLELLLDKGNADVGWVGEIDERAETSTPELMKLKISVHQIYAKPRVSQKVLDDASVDVEGWLVSKIGEKMALTENNAFIHGDGQGKPRGFLTYPFIPVGRGEYGKIEALKSGVDGDFADSDILIETLNAMKPQYLSGAVWLMSRSALAVVRRLRDKTTGNYLWQPGLIAGTPNTLLGHPVVVVDEMPALVAGTPSTSIVFANFHEAYQIVDRAGLHVLRDPYSAKPYVEFYATKRVGGDVVNFDAIKVIRFERE